jgi:hypothetical protein
MKRPRQPTLLLPAFDSYLKRNPVSLPTSQELRDRMFPKVVNPAEARAKARQFSATYRKLLPK